MLCTQPYYCLDKDKHLHGDCLRRRPLALMNGLAKLRRPHSALRASFPLRPLFFPLAEDVPFLSYVWRHEQHGKPTHRAMALLHAAWHTHTYTQEDEQLWPRAFQCFARTASEAIAAARSQGSRTSPA